MSEQDLAALGAAEEVAPSEQTEASEATKNTEGQVSDQPAEGEDTPEDKTKSQVRRERREQQRQREQQEAAETARKLADAEARLGRIKAAAQAIQEPKESEFRDYSEFEAARNAYHFAKAAAQFQETEARGELTAAEQARQSAEQARLAERQKAYVDEVPEARSRYADFDQVIAVAMRPDVVSTDLANLVLDSERPHDLAYHLGKNPEMARAISTLNPVQQARELGRIEATLALPRAKTQSSAPDPIRPLKGSASATSSPDNMTAAEYAAWRKNGGTFKL